MHTADVVRRSLHDAGLMAWRVSPEYVEGKRKGPKIIREDGLIVQIVYQEAGGPAPGIPRANPWAFGFGGGPRNPVVGPPPEEVYVPIGCSVLFDRKWRRVMLDLPPDDDYPANAIRRIDEMFPRGAGLTHWKAAARSAQGAPTRVGLLLDPEMVEEAPADRRLGMLFEDDE